MMKTINTLKTFALSLMAVSALSMSAQAANFGGVDVTPTEYDVTISKIEFKNATGVYVTFADGSFGFDIASANAGESVGALAVGNSLPAGAYTEMRVTIARTFGITASIADAGSSQPCHTATGNSSSGSLSGGAITQVSQGSIATPASPTKQSVNLPVGAPVTSALSGASLTEVGGAGGALQMSSAVSFSVDEQDQVMPTVEVDFDVTNAAEALTTGVGTCVVLPQPPVITVNVGS